MDSEVLGSGKDSATDLAVTLYNRVQLLKSREIQLKEKRGLIFSDDDLENAISVVENEIKSAQGNLQDIARKTSGKAK